MSSALSSCDEASIIIPCIRVEALLERCVRTCREVCPGAELIVVLDTDEGADRLGDVTLIVSGPVTIGAKRNLGVQHSRRRYVAFIDSDAYPQKGWLVNAIAALEQSRRVWAVGGPNVSPPDEAASERFVGLALRSILVSGPGYFIKVFGPRRTCEHLPSCNLVVRRANYLEMGGMDEISFAAEDNDFCLRLRRRGREILYSPDVAVYHKNRSLKWFFLQRVTYGAQVWDILRQSKSVSSFLMLAPGAFVLFVLSGWMAFLWSPYGIAYLAVLGLYLLALVVESARQSERSSDLAGTLLAMLVGNLAPGLGTLGQPFGLVPSLRKIYRNDR